MESTPLHKAVFFDRDGTINSDEGHYYIYKPDTSINRKTLFSIPASWKA